MSKIAGISVVVLTMATISQARADPAFGNNAINFTAIPNGPGFTITDNSATITKTPLGNGFSVDYTYTLTSTVANQLIDTTWSATRKFSLPAKQDLLVTISGSVSVTIPAKNTVDLLVTGAILPDNLDTIFTSDMMTGPLNAKAVKWDQSSKSASFAVDNNNGYTLDLFSGPDWTPNAVGDKLVVDALYTVTVGGVPEPSTWAMLLIGFAGLGWAGFRRARSVADRALDSARSNRGRDCTAPSSGR
jgi:PEP-CTERM motif